jgi:hypothetical protein
MARAKRNGDTTSTALPLRKEEVAIIYTHSPESRFLAQTNTLLRVFIRLILIQTRSSLDWSITVKKLKK